MPNPIDDDEKLAAALGRASSHWAHAEIHLASVFSILTDLDHAMAVTIFSFFKSVRTQKDVMLAVAKASSRCDAESLAVLTTLLGEYVPLASRRNALVHNPLGWESKEDNAVYLMRREKVTKPNVYPYGKAPVSVPEIDALTLEIKVLVRRLSDFSRELSNKALRPLLLAAALRATPPLLPPDTIP